MTGTRSPARVRDLTWRYLDERVKRGEITRGTAHEYEYQLASFAKACGNRPPEMLGRRQVERWMESRPLAPGHLADATVDGEGVLPVARGSGLLQEGHQPRGQVPEAAADDPAGADA